MSRGLSKEPFLSDVERLRRLMKVEDELARLKADYDRTREIVDLLVGKFATHHHVAKDEREDGVFCVGPSKYTGQPARQPFDEIEERANNLRK